MPDGPTVQASLKRAKRALLNGDTAAATTHFQTVLSRFPNNPTARKGLRKAGAARLETHLRAGQEMRNSGALDAAEREWAAALELAPESFEIALALAQIRLELGRIHQARDLVDVILRHAPDHATALDLRGQILRDLGDGPAAEASHLAALGHGQNDVGPLNNLGILAHARGDPKQAIDYYARALKHAPERADLHHNMSRVLKYTKSEPHLHQLLSLVANSDPHDSAQAPAHFALFNALDQIGEHEAAFAFLSTGNSLKKTQTRYDWRKEAMRFAFNKSLFTTQIPEISAPAPTGFRPVFTLGLPRSGTTLIERILAQSPDVKPCGELSVVSHAVAPLLRDLAARHETKVTAAEIETLRDALLRGFLPHAGETPVITDKMPLNFRWIGFICAALPEARIIHLQRDPMSVAWSLFRHLFSGTGNAFAYDISDICAFSLLHRDLMQHWRSRFPGRIHDVDYAALTIDPDPGIRALINASDVTWSDACLTPHTGRGAVLTASAAQVRNPIYQNSDQGWRRYAAELAPMHHALKVSGVLNPSPPGT